MSNIVPETPELTRSIGLIQAVALVVGIIIGASIFVQPSEITLRVGSLPGIVTVWLLCGVLTFFGALVVAELSSAFPQTGGVYVFLRESMGGLVAFLWGWANFWVIHSGIIAAIATVFARYLAYFLPLDDATSRLGAVAAIVAISAINYVGVRVGSAVMTTFTAGKLLAIALLLAMGFLLAPGPRASTVQTAGSGDSTSLSSLLLAVVSGLFAFGGWHMVTYAAGETRDAERTIPRAVLVGVLVVTVCYLALNTMYLMVLPLETVRSSTLVAADAARAVLGDPGSAVISALVVFSAFGGLTGIVLAGPRLYHSMARDSGLFSWLSAVHPRYRTPHRAIVLQAVWASVLAGTGSYRTLVARVIYSEWIFFALMAAGLFVLRQRPMYHPLYRSWGYPLVPAAFIAASSLIVVNQIVAQPRESIIGLALVATGWPIWRLTRKS